MLIFPFLMLRLFVITHFITMFLLNFRTSFVHLKLFKMFVMLRCIISGPPLANQSTAVLADSPQIAYKSPNLILRQWFVLASHVGQRILHSISCLKRTIIGAPVTTKEHSTRILFLTGTPSVIFWIFRTLFMVAPFSV